MIKLKILKLLTAQSFEIWRTIEFINIFLNQHEAECREEVKHLREELICADRTISFADLCIKKIRAVADYFPNFSKMLEKRIKEAGDLAKLITESSAIIKMICFNGKMPEVPLKLIMNYLGVKDMTNLLSM